MDRTSTSCKNNRIRPSRVLIRRLLHGAPAVSGNKCARLVQNPVTGACRGSPTIPSHTYLEVGLFFPSGPPDLSGIQPE